MEELITLVSEHEDWILKRVVDYAKVHEYTRYTSTLIEAWRISIASLNVAMFASIRSNEIIQPPSLDDKFNDTNIDRFSIQEVHKHRSRGITLGMFLGLVKYYRRSYFDLVREQNYDIRQEREYLSFLERFFDRFEIGYSVEWNALNDSQAADELRAQNRTLTNEKNKYLTIFESLYDPVILLDANNNIENINQASMELFLAHNLPAHRYYDQHPADQAFPWLAQEISTFSHGSEQEMIVVKSLQTPQGERHFQVKMKRMLDVSEKYRGIVLILNDLTERMKKEEAITLNRAIQKWVNSLVDISHQISSGLGTDRILPVAMSSLHHLTLPEEALLGMWEPEMGQFRIQYRLFRGDVEKVEFIFKARPEDLEVLETGCHAPFTCENVFHTLFIPLKMNEQMIGGLWVGRSRVAAFTSSEKAVLESIAQQISIAIEHAQMTAQVQSGAIVEERARLAREMHDGLSQILGFLNLEMQSLELLVQQNKIDATLKELGRARQRIRDAQAEVRENILNLRTALSKDGEAIPFLCEYIREFAAQTGIEAKVDVVPGEKFNLAPMCEVQLVRIMQEALTNIRLHAHANHVAVKFEQQDGQMCVEIRDDGIGFVEKTLKKHFGLQSMRERTESVNGQLMIESRLGHGTQVRLYLPLSQQPKEVKHAQAIAA